MAVADVLARTGPRKLLALDGGGIRGLISLGFVVRMEHLLREKLGADDSFRLADYFDYFAGTSTGAIIAAGLSIGMKAEEIRMFYMQHGREMFEKNWLLQQFKSKYGSENLSKMLQEVFGANTTLGTVPDPARGIQGPRTLLLVVMRNESTDSPWPISNHPRALFNDPASPECNLRIPLWQLVRASTAAPTYFPPEEINTGTQKFLFVDGGVTVFNNPAFQLFSMATASCYRLGWPTGEDKMLLVSIGTGTARDANNLLKASDTNLLYNASKVPSALMSAASSHQDFLCRMLGKCIHGAPINMEIGDMVGTNGVGPLASKLFTYVRYNVDISQKGLNDLGLNRLIAAQVQQMDSVDSLHDLDLIGQVGASKQVDEAHFQGFLGASTP